MMILYGDVKQCDGLLDLRYLTLCIILSVTIITSCSFAMRALTTQVFPFTAFHAHHTWCQISPLRDGQMLSLFDGTDLQL
jgi:Spy/CpxP family protein refolding chaperone